jgi:hypothetical protein
VIRPHGFLGVTATTFFIGEHVTSLSRARSVCH